METLKIGNTYFRKDACKGWDFETFKNTYGILIKGVDLEEAFKQAGGTIKEAKAKKENTDNA